MTFFQIKMMDQVKEHKQGDPKGAKDLLHELTEEIKVAKILRRIKDGKLSREGWLEFAGQRYLSALDFEALLETGIARAEVMEDDAIRQVLLSNLQDEQGVNSKGQPLAIGSHEVWRRDFYGALGINENDLTRLEPACGVLAYRKVITDLITNGSHFKIFGGILMSEYSIPAEFACIQAGMDQAFPEVFVIGDNDDSEVRNRKRKDRRYIDHHIAHDAKQHFPQLFEVLSRHLSNAEEQACLVAGIQLVGQARKQLYESLEKIS